MDLTLVLGCAIALIVLILSSITDIRALRIPDVISLGGLLALLVLDAIFEPSEMLLKALSALIAFSSLSLVRIGTKKKLGWGDIKLCAFCAYFLSFLPWAIGLLCASIFALAFLLAAHALGRWDYSKPLPFAPFIAAGSIVAWLLEPLYQGFFALPW